jgi:hypothetical protein
MLPRPWTRLLLAALVLAGGCSPEAAATTDPSTPDPSAPAPDMTIAVEDPRLGPVLSQIVANPDWADGAVTDLSVAQSLPSLDELCVEVARPGRPSLYVAVDVDEPPWRVGAMSMLDANEDLRISFEADDRESDGGLCWSVLLGTDLPFPADASGVELNGGLLDPAHGPAIQAALHAAPERFGIERTGMPAINVEPMPAGEDRACYEGVVYLGGPRAQVVVGLREEAGAWQVASVRVIRQALRPPEPQVPGAC